MEGKREGWSAGGGEQQDSWAPDPMGLKAQGGGGRSHHARREAWEGWRVEVIWRGGEMPLPPQTDGVKNTYHSSVESADQANGQHRDPEVKMGHCSEAERSLVGQGRHRPLCRRGKSGSGPSREPGHLHLEPGTESGWGGAVHATSHSLPPKHKRKPL